MNPLPLCPYKDFKMKRFFNKHWVRAQRNALRVKAPVTHSKALTLEQQYDWVNIEPVEHTVRLWVKLRAYLLRALGNLVWAVLLVTICYTGFRALDYRAIEEGCLRYELTPSQVSGAWDKICKQ